jgi:hypothetical protein
MDWEDGSITLFMTLIFLLLFALTGAALDSARFFSSKGYVLASAYGGEVAMYGRYNRELYENYGLFAYGGYDGLDTGDWQEEFLEILRENLQERPANTGTLLAGLDSYASVYQLQNPQVELKKTAAITDKKQFLKQVDDWLETSSLQDITASVLEKVQGTDSGQQGELLYDLDENTQVEAKEEEQKETASEQETVVENPLEFLKELLQDGVLNLVCDRENISEKEIEKREESSDKETKENGSDWFLGNTGTGILKNLMGQQDSLWNDEMTSDKAKKGKLIAYASGMLTSYVSPGESALEYGLEYLVTGKTREKDAFAEVVNRLFLIRTLMNYVYVKQDAALEAASLETAAAIAAPLMAESLIPVIQRCILLVLSLEESCVDICALLEGRQVPMTKNKSTFRMSYEEICRAGKTLFQSKAKSYEKAETVSALKKVTGGFSYRHYLWILLLMQSYDTLQERLFDVIQYDLRERVNQTFTLEDCICYTETEIRYEIPLLYWGIRSGFRQNTRGSVMRSVTVKYGY